MHLQHVLQHRACKSGLWGKPKSMHMQVPWTPGLWQSAQGAASRHVSCRLPAALATNNT
jgi:hypothetical protein